MTHALGMTEQEVISKIYLVRGKKVMMDRDLAAMYGVETRVLNQAVRRNPDRFPEDFMFQLTPEELEDWKSQIVTSNLSNKEKMGLRKLPNVFTEQGVAMLSSVLNSSVAIAVNIRIIRIFTRLREVLLGNHEILLKLEQLDKKIINLGFDVRKHDGEIATIFELIQELTAMQQSSGPREQIGFRKPGQD